MPGTLNSAVEGHQGGKKRKKCVLKFAPLLEVVNLFGYIVMRIGRGTLGR